MISYDLLLQFESPSVPVKNWPTKPVTVGNMLRLAVQHGWLASSIPFGRTLSGSESVWNESLVLTDAGRKAMK